jgi:large subunit ribosomal protein L18
MITKKKTERRQRLKHHIRLRVLGTAERPRLTVYRSLHHIYAQIIDDTTGKTLVAVSDTTKGVKAQVQGVKGQVALGKRIGQLAAERALAQQIRRVIFDRNGYLYHGAVKALADGAREGGLEF